MSAKRKISATNTLRLRCFNIVIQPVDAQCAEAYIRLFRRIFEIKTPVVVTTGKLLAISSMEIGEKMISGKLVKYDADSEMPLYNSETSEIENVDVGSSRHPNPQEFEYYFFPKTHALYVDEKLSTVQITKFFESSIDIVEDYLGFDVVFNTISTHEGIQQIQDAENVQYLKIRISYSNADNPEDWEKFIDDGMKSSHVGTYEIEAKSTKNNPIEIRKNQFLMSALMLAVRNGYAKAKEVTKRGTKWITTSDSPKIVDVKYKDDSIKLEEISKLSEN